MTDVIVPPRERAPIIELLRIAAPTVATMTSYTMMTFVDALMVSRYGADPINVAAQGNGNAFSFIPISIMMGLLSVVNTFVSQNLGAGTPRNGAAYAWAALWMSLGAWLCLIPLGLATPWIFTHAPTLMDVEPHAPEMIALESSYARILIFGSILTLSTRSLSHFFYGLHRPLVVFAAAVTGNLVNFFANLVLVFGDQGAPEALINVAGPGVAHVFRPIAEAAHSLALSLGVAPKGVAGAAMGTLIGSFVELSIPLSVFLGARMNRLYGTRAAWRPRLQHFRDLLRVGWPASLMFGNEMICWTLFMAVLVSAFGKEHNAAGWITLRYMHISFMPAVGISFAVTALVGKCMGMKRPDLAAQRARLGLFLTMTYMGLCALAFVLFHQQLIDVFIDSDASPEVRARILHIGSQVMIVAAVFQVFDAMGITIIGALRGAGDTVWPGVLTMILSWTFIVGLGWLLTKFVPELNSVGPWIGAAAYVIILGLFLLHRFFRGRWKTIDLLTTSAPAVH